MIRENTFYHFYLFYLLNWLRSDLWPGLWPILENVLKHEHLRRMYVMLLFGRVFYKCLLCLACLYNGSSLLSFLACLVFLFILKEGCTRLNSVPTKLLFNQTSECSLIWKYSIFKADTKERNYVNAVTEIGIMLVWTKGY